MQSVPSEFVTQLRPLMFVAGLGNEQTQEPALPSSPPSTSETPSPFVQLVQSLRQVLVAKRAFQLYDSPAGKSNAQFHVALVDKVNYRQHVTSDMLLTYCCRTSAFRPAKPDSRMDRLATIHPYRPFRPHHLCIRMVLCIPLGSASTRSCCQASSS